MSLYIQDNKGDVYKVMKNHYLKLSPWESNEDRRVSAESIDYYNIISEKEANKIVNIQFDIKDEYWTFNGKDYAAARITKYYELDEDHLKKIKSLPAHRKERYVIVKNDEPVFIEQSWKIVKHKGKLYYIEIIDAYLPRVKAYDMKGQFAQWVGINHCKPVYCITDNLFL